MKLFSSVLSLSTRVFIFILGTMMIQNNLHIYGYRSKNKANLKNKNNLIWQPHFYDIIFDFINSWGYCSRKYLWSGMHLYFQLNSPKTNIISSYIVYCYMHLLRYTKVSTCIQFWNRREYTNLVRESFEIEPIAHTILYKNSSKHRKLTRGIRIK